jgi:protein-disulfide isomerase
VLAPEERKKLRELAKDPAIAAGIERDVQLGERSQVSSTPTMIITHNGSPSPIVGVVTYAVVSRYIDSLLTPKK